MAIIKASATISMGHRLPSYKGICSSPHGHNVTVDVTVFAADKEFVDFKKVGDILELVLADFDHAMVLHDRDPLLTVLRTFGFRTVALNIEPTTEAIAAYVFNEIREAGFMMECVKVHETAKYSAIVCSHDARVKRTS